jgi:hypothetical protein
VKIIFYFHDEDLKIQRGFVHEYPGTHDQGYMLVNMNPEKPWLNYASRKLSAEEFERELEYLRAFHSRNAN